MPEFDDSFDRKLVEWFAPRKGVWSGTATELLAAVRSGSDTGSLARAQPARTLYAHLESHRHILRSGGIDVRLHQDTPRILSLRHCAVEMPTKKPPATASAFHHPLDSPVSSIPLVDNAQAVPAASEEAKSAAGEASGQDTSIARPDSAARFVSGRYAEKESVAGRVFENSGMALSTVAEIRDLIRDPNLDLEAAVELMANRAQEITQCCGTAVGLRQENSVVYLVRTGIGATIAGLELQVNFFQSCVRMGGALQLLDAQRHPLLGRACQLEEVGSLIIVPIFHHREVVGAMEFFYKEMQSFSIGQVMDLELIAGIVSERLGSAAKFDLKSETAHDGCANTQADDNSEPQPSDTANSAILSSLTSRLAAAPTRVGRALKRVIQGAQAGPATQENVTTSDATPETNVDGAGPALTES